MLVNPGLRRSSSLRGGVPVANLAARFDASLGITSAGGFASQWNDLSGNARHLLQATGANQPIHLPYAGTKYGWSAGVAGNYWSMPASAATAVDDFDVDASFSLTTFPPVANTTLLGQDPATDIAFDVYIDTAGKLNCYWSQDGSTIGASRTVLSAASLSTVGAVSGGPLVYVRVKRNKAAGTVDLYSSTDGVTWVAFGAQFTGKDTNSVHVSSGTFKVGANGTGATTNLNGKIGRARMYNGDREAGGTLAVDFDPSRWSSGTTFTASTGETWTINSTGSKPAQIVDRPSLLFDGAAHFMKCNAFTLNQPETVYLVGKQITWNSGDYLLDGNALNGGGLIAATGTPQINLNAGSSVAGNTEMTLGANKVLCAVFNGASSSLQVTTGTATTGNVGAGNMGGFTLGAAGSNLLFGNLQAYETIIYSVAHDAATRANVIRALMTKWGVA